LQIILLNIVCNYTSSSNTGTVRRPSAMRGGLQIDRQWPTDSTDTFRTENF